MQASLSSVRKAGVGNSRVSFPERRGERAPSAWTWALMLGGGGDPGGPGPILRTSGRDQHLDPAADIGAARGGIGASEHTHRGAELPPLLQTREPPARARARLRLSNFGPAAGDPHQRHPIDTLVPNIRLGATPSSNWAYRSHFLFLLLPCCRTWKFSPPWGCDGGWSWQRQVGYPIVTETLLATRPEPVPLAIRASSSSYPAVVVQLRRGPKFGPPSANSGQMHVAQAGRLRPKFGRSRSNLVTVVPTSAPALGHTLVRFRSMLANIWSQSSPTFLAKVSRFRSIRVKPWQSSAKFGQHRPQLAQSWPAWGLFDHFGSTCRQLGDLWDAWRATFR